jgi:hypothetical protein
MGQEQECHLTHLSSPGLWLVALCCRYRAEGHVCSNLDNSYIGTTHFLRCLVSGTHFSFILTLNLAQHDRIDRIESKLSAQEHDSHDVKFRKDCQVVKYMFSGDRCEGAVSKIDLGNFLKARREIPHKRVQCILQAQILNHLPCKLHACLSRGHLRGETCK